MNLQEYSFWLITSWAAFFYNFKHKAFVSADFQSSLLRWSFLWSNASWKANQERWRDTETKRLSSSWNVVCALLMPPFPFVFDHHWFSTFEHDTWIEGERGGRRGGSYGEKFHQRHTTPREQRRGFQEKKNTNNRDTPEGWGDGKMEGKMGGFMG